MTMERTEQINCMALEEWCVRETALGLPAIGGKVIKKAGGYVLAKHADEELWLGPTLEAAAAKIDIFRILAKFEEFHCGKEDNDGRE